MEILTVLAILVLCLTVHEGGHLFAMISHGIPVQKAGIGFGSFIEIPFPRIANLSQDSRKPFVFTLSPILLGAYVQPTEKGKRMIDQLPYASKVNIYAAGPLANIVFAVLLLNIWAIFMNSITWWKLLAALAAVLLAAGFSKRAAPIFSYVMPAIGVLVTVGITAFLIVSGSGSLAGPIGIFQQGSKVARDFSGSISLLFSLSVSFGLFNLLLLTPLDGGKIAEAVMEKFGVSEKRRHLYLYVSFACLGIFALFVFGNDIARLFQK